MYVYVVSGVAIAAIYVLSAYLREARRENRQLKDELKKLIKMNTNESYAELIALVKKQDAELELCHDGLTEIYNCMNIKDAILVIKKTLDKISKLHENDNKKARRI